MRIVLINWAPLWEGASFGGGVNGYVQALALELVRRGHDVTSLFGGLVYVPERAAREGPFLRRHDDWLGVRIFEVINSPVLAPSLSQFADPLGEVSQPALERLIGEALGHLRPDVVHFHNLEGFSAGCIRAAKASGARVVYSLHNYHTLCSQVTLCRNHRWACLDYEDGHACASCIRGGTADPRQERRRRIAEHRAHCESGHSTPDETQREWASFKHELSWPKRLAVKGTRVLRAWRRRRAAASAGGGAAPGRAVRDANDYTAPQPAPGGPQAEQRGQAPALLSQQAPLPERDPRDLPVLNVIQPQRVRCAPRPLRDGEPESPYAVRRRELVRMLGACDRVLAVSSFVARKFESMGVPRERLTVMPIGTRANELAHRNADVLFDPPPFERLFPQAGDRRGSPSPAEYEGRERPIRLVFLGYNHFNKGLPLLAEALERLDADCLGRLDLSIFALGGETIEWRFRRMEPRLAGLRMTHGYQHHDIPWCLGGKDLTYVGSTWWDPAPQTVFESFACGVPVLGAELGGIPDFVKHGVNGVLFRGNDAADLATRLRDLIDAPWVLTRLRANVRPPKDIAEHAAELEQVYRNRRSPSPTIEVQVAVPVSPVHPSPAQNGHRLPASNASN